MSRRRAPRAVRATARARARPPSRRTVAGRPRCARRRSPVLSWYRCTITRVPRRVDRDMRRREITDAVIRITVKGGLASATFREVAADAGVSVRLVQYYFGTKDPLLLATQRRVAERSIARIQRFQAEAGAGGTPRQQIRTIMRSFVPVDDESRDAMLVYIALFTASLLDPTLKRREAGEVPASMQRVFADRLRQAKLRPGVDPDQEALILLMVDTGVSQGVLDGQITVERGFETIDYALDRALRP